MAATCAATAEQLRAALESDNHAGLRRLCQRLDRDLSVAACGFEMPVTHHVAMKPYGLDCLKCIVDKLGPECLTVRNQNRNTPVHLAAMFQDKHWMAFILHAAGPECLEEGGKHRRTPAHFAAMNEGGNSALKWLAKHLGQRCLRACDDEGNTPLHLSAWKQGSDSMRFFKRELGEYCFQLRGRCQRTAVHQAATNKVSCEAFQWLVRECGPDCLKVTDEQGNTPAHLAAWKQGEESVKLVREQLGSDAFKLRGLHGYTVVHYAALNTTSNSALLWCVKELDRSCLLARDPQDRTPIHLAAQHQEDAKAMQMAVNALGRACLTEPDQRLRTAVHWAAVNQRSNAALVWIVGQLGPDCLKLADGDGSAPVHLAARHQGVESLRFIRDTLGGAAFQLEDANKRTMAHYAAETGHGKNDPIDWIAREIGPQCLLACDTNGITPAHLAGFSVSDSLTS